MLAVMNKKQLFCRCRETLCRGGWFGSHRQIYYIRYFGRHEYTSQKREAVLNNGFEKSSKSRRFIKGVEKDGRVTIQSSQGNGSLKSTVGCNCFVDIPTGSKNLSAGDKAVVLLV